MSYVKKLLFLIFFPLALILEAKPPELTASDTLQKTEEMLKSHVSYHSLNTELIKRTFQNFLEELDPSKTYFLESEVAKWLSPSDDFLKTTLEKYKSKDFSPFDEVFSQMLAAVQRRNQFEEKIELTKLPEGVQPSEFKDLKWAMNEDALFDRLIRLRALQLEAALKFSKEAAKDTVKAQEPKDTQTQISKRLTKYRLKREAQFVATSPKEREQNVLSFILKAFSSALDSHTAYFTPSEANQFIVQVQQRLFGIGAQLKDDLNGFTVVKMLEGSPAATKLKAQDRIIAINKEPVIGMDIIEVVEMIRGPRGTPIYLTVLREAGEGDTKKEEQMEIEIIRDEVLIKESRLETSYEPFGDGIIAILNLHCFYQDPKYSSSSDLLEAMEKLKKDHKIKGIILDLRNNGGGVLPQAVAVSGLFITKGVVVSVKDNSGDVQHLRTLESKMTWDGPLIILTNKLSASASEIVAQTLQDYGRALVIGDKETHGKGTFQTFSLESSNFAKINPKGEFKITRGMYYTVSGKSPQLTGVQADIIVPGPFTEMEIGEKFAKFPLENDHIPPSFDDNLADIPFFYRNQLLSLYKNNLQPILTTYIPYLELLKKNSEERIAFNLNYQNFLKETSKKENFTENAEKFGRSDLQLSETLNVMKDLILLMQSDNRQVVNK